MMSCMNCAQKAPILPRMGMSLVYYIVTMLRYIICIDYPDYSRDPWPVAETWRRVWGTDIFFRGRRFLSDCFSEKISIFTANISYDLCFSHVIDQVFWIFTFFSQIFPIFTMLNVVYDPFLTRKPPFLLCSYFSAHPTTLLLKILGGRMHGPSPHLKFMGGTSPPQSP